MNVSRRRPVFCASLLRARALREALPALIVHAAHPD